VYCFQLNIQAFSYANFCCYFNFRQTYLPYLPRSTVIDQTPMPCAVFAASPSGSALLVYFQAAGKAKKALL
jgi:hypothetical protein